MTVTAGAFLTAIKAASAERTDRPAFTFLDANLEATTYTFGELWGRASAIAVRIRERGLADPTRPLGLLLGSQEDQILHYLGALQAGAVPAILTPPNRKLNRQYYAITMVAVLRRSGFGAIVTDVDDVPLPVPAFQPHSIDPVPGEEPGVANTAAGEPLEASFLQFSSGTTGIKRGVLVRDEAALAQLHAYAAALALSPDDRIVTWLPLYHDMGFIACLNMPLLFGVHTIVIDPITWVTRPGTLLRAASRYAATLSWNPNFAYAFMAHRVRERELDGVDLSSLRGLANCSEPVTHTSQQQFMERFARYGLRDDVFLGCYAMAETTFALTHGVASDPGYLDPVGPQNAARSEGADPYVSVGQPIDGVQLEVVDEHGTRCSDRSIGELWVKSPFNFTGYYREPDATAEAFVDGWYRTGDLGYRVGSSVFVTGRQKDVLIIGGVNVFPNDVEDVVNRVEGVIPGRTAVFAQFDSRMQTERITILAESDSSAHEAREVVMAIRQWVQASFELASFEVHLVPVGWLVKSSSGKVARSANRDKWNRERAAAASADPQDRRTDQ